MKAKTLVVNALVAALYIAVTALVAPFGFTNIQFRISEIFNHLVVFNKKYFFGIVVGVFLSNLLLSPFKLDLIFGVAHSAISLGIVILAGRYIKDIWALLVINTLVFTFNMFIIAWEIKIIEPDTPFFLVWLTTAVGEFGVLAIGIPIMYALNKRINFNKLI
ncbi:QueT transporter family protein [Ornithinibacillus halotolerans]|uniref:Membrane protein n=1 Tax=Ornithinibacillus halotolerans TaxID=1274357 RepID=A0A916W909_9BACI|nr:QueT transporter family protein [Ornithinibacillus halotolerans]GGA78171.1 membrane protein [Ornithinibacillus halotolerans]